MTALVRGRTKGEVKMEQKDFTYDYAEEIGEAIDDEIRTLIAKTATDVLLEGGYNIITDDLNFEKVEVLEIYYSIKKE